MKTHIFSIAAASRLASRVGAYFKTRDFILHDGRNQKRFRVGVRAQAMAASVVGVSMCFSAYGVAQAAVGAATMTGIVATPEAPEIKVAQMRLSVARLQRDIATIRAAAEAHAVRVDQRQALLVAAVGGKADVALLSQPTPIVDAKADAIAADVVAPLKKIEAQQLAAAGDVRRVANQRLSRTVAHLRTLGIAPERLVKRQVVATGGPFEAASSSAAEADLRADTQFRSLFMTWKKLDTLQQGTIAIPSAQPVEHLAYTSNYGIRSDPFRGTAAMHAGVDIPGPMGTPVYATADGVVDRAERAGGYGNLVELDHGKGIQTRYGHLSKILVEAGTRVHRGQLIALLGSTGRSTGPHLHYEVRIDGHAVNPVPFLQTADYLVAAQDKSIHAIPVSVGGPAAADAAD
ncbi:M23 family metallopeptidase [Sphingomonas echinoides]|uniref:M23 family metallopeptidase n=1 Tax=Sphingomonas echinoides TaxID=59803 RepID=UPI002413C6CB|nr:M23 family metallopeptidase [Sphingomonas echinoides]